MSNLAPDLDAYFARIGYSGPREPSLAVLNAVHAHHVRAIPFENIDVLLGRGIRIDLLSIEQKLVKGRRGGYCFEQNGLFSAVLRALGFAVTPLIARVRWQVPEGTNAPFTHMLIRVETEEGSFLADVGFGSMSLSQPLRLEFDREQSGSLEPRRLVQRGPEVVQQARLGDTWSDMYQFSLSEALDVDFEMGNWYTSTHPNSRFMQNIIAARAGDGLRHTLLNCELSTRYADGRVERRTLESQGDLIAALASHFDLHFEPGTRISAPFAALPP
jgi:N-hydroxyarylamine O-acetyltransferase